MNCDKKLFPLRVKKKRESNFFLFIHKLPNQTKRRKKVLMNESTPKTMFGSDTADHEKKFYRFS